MVLGEFLVFVYQEPPVEGTVEEGEGEQRELKWRETQKEVFGLGVERFGALGFCRVTAENLREELVGESIQGVQITAVFEFQLGEKVTYEFLLTSDGAVKRVKMEGILRKVGGEEVREVVCEEELKLVYPPETEREGSEQQPDLLRYLQRLFDEVVAKGRASALLSPPLSPLTAEGFIEHLWGLIVNW